MVVVPIVACSASGDGANVTDDPQPDPTSQLPGSDGSTTPEGSTPRDGSTNDAGKDSGPPPPNPGDPCPVENAKFTKSCGKCGTQTALCLEKKVTEYGVCENEMGVCNPGEQAECGKCGKQTCTQYCIWGGCGGEKTGPTACFAGQYDLDSAGCGVAGTWRTRKCKADCTYNSFSTSCFANPTGDNGAESPEWTMAAPATVGQISSVVLPLRATYAADRFTSTCPIAGTTNPTAGAYPISYVTVTNPTGQTLTATAWADPASILAPRVVMAWYPTTARPSDVNERRACSKGMALSCPANLSPECTSTTKAGLTSTNSLVIPPGSGVLLYIGAYDAGAAGAGDIRIKVRTDLLQ